ncbi:effector-associated domain EAD1-containing protein [Methylovulum psychrotolerans]|uniref:Phosphorylase n=1 Tax=Methylovulum psychrotolerans TaxID=1704499 RepID=A0A1Z4BYL9_9GAMM|nr:effector-associated domain EAD1-containing protein [Methylovulum psychrotolerans]ASF46378.1 phosphorylase [Methylovulum psychrotolerans]
MNKSSQLATNPTSKQPIDVMLICALKDEYDQVLQVTNGLVNPWHEHSDANGWLVADASFATPSGNPLTIRATHASYMGREQVQAFASKLINDNPASCIAMSGICAGRRGKVDLGDVIFAERLWSYDVGKTTIENGEQRFQGDMLQYRPSTLWVQRMQHFNITPDTDWLTLRPQLSYEYQEDWVLLRRLADDSNPSLHPDCHKECPDWSEVLKRLWQKTWLEKPLVLTETGRKRAEELQLLHPLGLPKPASFNIHTAPITTGATVTEDPKLFDRLADSMRKVLGIEMEASSLGALGDIHDIPVLVAKGVSDFGDAFKDDRYRPFAARASAECLIALLRDGEGLLPNRASRNTGILAASSPSLPDLSGIPRDLIEVLAEQYPDVRDARALWQRAGGKASQVENIPNPRDLWQRLWQASTQGAAARREDILAEALVDLPANPTLQNYLAALKLN